MRLYDANFFSSRLIGQNSYFNDVGAVIEIDLTKDNRKIAKLYVEALTKLLASLPIKNYTIKSKVFKNGLNIAVSYPYDLLMVACEILDWVWEDIVDLIDLEVPIDSANARRKFKKIIKDKQNLFLRKIYANAKAEQVNFFVDKNSLILGSGCKQFRTKLNKINRLSDIPWEKIADIPIILITGTNGKTTTTRLTEFICRKGARLRSGYSSTDWVMINNKLTASGDLSGPLGHHLVLTNKKLEVAVLEVARGGLVKRGLLPNYVSTATVTNIAADHLHQSGIETLTDLTRTKTIIYNALKPSGIAIINLDDKYIKKLALTHNTAFLSTKLTAAKMAQYLTATNFIVYLENNYIIIQTAQNKYQLNQINQLPLTVDGLARYNYENILNAVSLSFALGLAPKEISRGLQKFSATAKSNFGRWNHYLSEKYGHLVVDIAHNPAGLENILNLAQQFRAKNKLTGKFGLMYGNTGDRKDLIPETAALIIKHQVDEVVIKEFQKSLRGSKLGEMPKLFHDELIKQGYPAPQIKIIPNELKAVKRILSKAKAKDMFLLCTHELLNDVSQYVARKSNPGK